MGRLLEALRGQRSSGLLRARHRASDDRPGAPQGQPHRHGDRGQDVRRGARRVGPGAPPRRTLRRDLVRLRRGRAAPSRRSWPSSTAPSSTAWAARAARWDSRRWAHGRRARLSAAGLPQARAGERRSGLDRRYAGMLARGTRRRRRERPPARSSPWLHCSRMWPSASPPRRSCSRRPGRSCCRGASQTCPGSVVVSSTHCSVSPRCTWSKASRTSAVRRRRAPRYLVKDWPATAS